MISNANSALPSSPERTPTELDISGLSCPVGKLEITEVTRELHIPHLHVLEEVEQVGAALELLLFTRRDLTSLDIVQEYFAGTASAREERLVMMQTLLSQSPSQLTQTLSEALSIDASDTDLYLIGVAREVVRAVDGARRSGREISINYDILESFRPLAADLAWLAAGCQEEVNRSLSRTIYNEPKKRLQKEKLLDRLITLQVESLALELVLLDSGRNGDMADNMRKARTRLDERGDSQTGCVAFLYGSNHEAPLMQRLKEVPLEELALFPKSFSGDLDLELNERGLLPLGLVNEVRNHLLRVASEKMGVDAPLAVKDLLSSVRELAGGERTEFLEKGLDIALDDSRTRFSRIDAERCLVATCLLGAFARYNEEEQGYYEVTAEDQILCTSGILCLSDEKVDLLLTASVERAALEKRSIFESFISVLAEVQGCGSTDELMSESLRELKDNLRGLLDLGASRSSDACFFPGERRR